jgi:hypothetical protein
VLVVLRAQQGRLEEADRMATEVVAYFSGTDFSIDRVRAIMDRAGVHRLVGRPNGAIEVIEDAMRLSGQGKDVASADLARRAIDKIAGA